MPVYNFSHSARTAQGLVQPYPAGLRMAGPSLQVEVSVPTALANQLQAANQPIPNPVLGLGIVDTGASISAVDSTVISQLGVQPVGTANVGTAGGPQTQFTYPAKFTFPGTGIPSIEFSTLIGSNLTGQIVPGPQQGNLIVLLGRDILEHFIFVYNGPSGMFTLAL